MRVLEMIDYWIIFPGYTRDDQQVWEYGIRELSKLERRQINEMGIRYGSRSSRSNFWLFVNNCTMTLNWRINPYTSISSFTEWASAADFFQNDSFWALLIEKCQQISIWLDPAGQWEIWVWNSEKRSRLWTSRNVKGAIVKWERGLESWEEYPEGMESKEKRQIKERAEPSACSCKVPRIDKENARVYWRL